MMLLPFVAIAFSLAVIIPLCRGDPKRRRSARLQGEGMGTRARRMLAAIACLPGLVCALAGDASAFLIWLGGTAVAGWFVALWFGQARQDAA
jgi:hypothetical protein